MASSKKDTTGGTPSPKYTVNIGGAEVVVTDGKNDSVMIGLAAEINTRNLIVEAIALELEKGGVTFGCALQGGHSDAEAEYNFHNEVTLVIDRDLGGGSKLH